MSHCKSDGKDRIVFLTKEETVPPPDEKQPEFDGNQYFMPNGEINWDCPCHGTMIYGPCALEYREFLTSCVFPKGEANDEKCQDKYTALEKCVTAFPTVFPDLQPDEINKATDASDNTDQVKTS